jgi:hypothetical protein
MRKTLYVIGFIVFCLLGFLLIGVFKPMISYDLTIKINRPLAKCWTIYQTDSLKYRWMPGYKRTILMKGDSLSNGTQQQIIFQSDEAEVAMIQTIDSIQNESFMAYNVANHAMNIHTKITFLATEQHASTIQVHNEIRANNIFLKSLMVFMKSKFESSENSNYQNLKELIESKQVDNL